MLKTILRSHLFRSKSSISSARFVHNSAPKIIITDNEEVDTVLKNPLEFIRNFSIIAHIDHGKSTLADRLLEFLGNIEFGNSSISGEHAQILDTLEVERERGITVKAQNASLFYFHPPTNSKYLLNLIDTPGHVDFSYEVSRSLAACQGALLLVDSSQGVEAQTIATYELAALLDLAIVPVLTKSDLPHSNPEKAISEMEDMFGIDGSEVIVTSSKTGEGIADIFDAIVRQIPPPTGNPKQPLRALLFDSWYQRHRGVACLINVKDGELRKGDRIGFLNSDEHYDVQQIGILIPSQRPVDVLRCGQVGYVLAGMKSTREVSLGDTMYQIGRDKKLPKLSDPIPIVPRSSLSPLPGFQEVKSMVFASLYPSDPIDYDILQDAMDKLTLNDASVTVQRESSVALGLGFRCGFLGVLHMEVFKQRLEQDFGASVIVTAPTVPYKAIMRNGDITMIDSPLNFPEVHYVEQFLQPTVRATIITPQKYINDIARICDIHEGLQEDFSYLESGKVLFKYKFMLNQIVTEFASKIKSASQGYASFDYEEAGYVKTVLCRIDVLVNSNPVDALSTICEKDKAYVKGKYIVRKLKDLIQKQRYEVVIQAAIGKRIIAKERIAALKKDILKKHGKTIGVGDVTRKRKIIDRYKENQKKLKAVGNVQVPKEAFLEILKY